MSYDHSDGKTYIMVIHEAFYFKTLKHNLLNPNELCLHGLEINECPKSLKAHPTERDHAIYAPDEDLLIDLALHGVVSCFQSRKPSEDELLSCPRVEMTSTTAWDPHNARFSKNEKNMISSLPNDENTPVRKLFSVQIKPSLLIDH